MGAVFRLLTLLLIGGFVVSMLMHKVTGEPAWRQRAMQILKWGVVLGMCVLGLFVLRRGAVFI